MAIEDKKRKSEPEPNFLEKHRLGLKTEGEVSQHIHPHDESGNLTYLPERWLHRGRDVLKVAQAVIVSRHEDSSYRGTYISIEVWNRYKKSQMFEKASQLKLGMEETQELLNYLRQTEASGNVEEGITVPLPAAEILDNLDPTQRQTFVNILSDPALSHHITEFFNSGQLTTQTLQHLAAAAQQVKYKAELHELCEMIDGIRTKTTKDGKAKSLDEHSYQTWFEEHTWVFGTEYIRRINLRDIDTHASVDIVLETADGFFDVLELKTPEAEVLAWDKSHKTWYFSSDTAKVIAQAVKYFDSIERSSEKIYHETRGRIVFVRPRIRVVIGRADMWQDEQREAFRRLSATLHGIDLMTFDHVVDRAKQLIACYEHPLQLETITLHPLQDQTGLEV